MLETSDFVHGSAMWSLRLAMSECSLSGRGQGHVSNFYIVDLENFATGSPRYTDDISLHSSTVVGLFMTPETMGADSVASWLSAHCLSRIASDQISNFILSIWSGPCRISSFCTVAWQLARFQLTRRIARSLGDSWASCWLTDWHIDRLKPSVTDRLLSICGICCNVSFFVTTVVYSRWWDFLYVWCEHVFVTELNNEYFTRQKF